MMRLRKALPSLSEIKSNPEVLQQLFGNSKENRVKKYLEIKEKKMEENEKEGGLSFEQQL